MSDRATDHIGDLISRFRKYLALQVKNGKRSEISLNFVYKPCKSCWFIIKYYHAAN